MFTISTETTFTASHQLALTDPSGIQQRPCQGPQSQKFSESQKEPLHCHNWVVTAAASAKELDQRGYVIDFGRFKAMLEEITAPFNNTQLEQLEYFQRKSSTAENLAKYIYDKLTLLLPSQLRLDYIKVTEVPGSLAKYSPDI